MNTSDGNSLGTIGIETRELFSSLTTPSKKANLALHFFDPEQLTTDFERFELWAANLGLNAPGHGSLDYRLRDWEVADSVVRRLLKDVRDALADVAILLSGPSDGEDNKHDEKLFPSDDKGRAPIQSSHSSDSVEQEDDLRALGYGSGDDDVDSFTESLEMHGHKISDALDRLYRIATKIRSPAARHLSDQVLSLKQIDPESGIDLMSIYAEYDERHISEMLDRSKIGTGEREVTQQDIDARRGRKAHFLVSRLAQGNLVRRKQFHQWKRHRLKLEMASYSTSDAPGEVVLPRLKPSVPPRGLNFVTPSAMGNSLPTTATMLNVQNINWDEDKSIVSVSEYAVNANASEDESPEFPDPPIKKRGTKHFECSYCFTICPNAYLATRDAWRSHLIRDLRPYMCTYEECVSGQELYATRSDWIQHETSSHRRVWRCLEHTDIAFDARFDYEMHLQQEHADVSKSLRSVELLKAGESTDTQAARVCPFCGKKLAMALDLQYHIAVHLERVAAFSLPRSTGQEQDSEAGSNWSDQVNRADQSSPSDLLSSSDAEVLEVKPTAEVAQKPASITPQVLSSVIADDAIIHKLEAFLSTPDSVKNLILDEAKTARRSGISAIFGSERFLPHLSIHQTQSVSLAIIEWKRRHDPERNLNSDVVGALEAFLEFLLQERESRISARPSFVDSETGPLEASRRAINLKIPSYRDSMPTDAKDRGHEDSAASQHTAHYTSVDLLGVLTPRNLQEACSSEFRVRLDSNIAEKLCSTFNVDAAQPRRCFENALNFLKAWADLFVEFSEVEDEERVLTISDFSKALVRFGYRLNASFVRLFFTSAILDRFPSTPQDAEDLRMTFNQFVTSCTMLKQSTDVFKNFDQDRDGYITLSFEEALNSWMELCTNRSGDIL